MSEQQVSAPALTEKDLEDVPPAVRRALHFVFAGDMTDVLRVALNEARPAGTEARQP